MLDKLIEIWQSFGLIEKIYWCFSFYFSLLFIIHFFLIVFGRMKTTEGNIRKNGKTRGPSMFDLITKRYSLPFFVVFCWCGLACYYSGIGLRTNLIISALAGLFVIVFLTFVLFIQKKNNTDIGLESREPTENPVEIQEIN